MEAPIEDKLDFSVKPPIYSKSAVLWFSFFFTPLFGGILLMQNLRDINKTKEATTVLITSLLMTVAIATIQICFNLDSRLVSLGLNFGAAYILSDFFYKKYIPDADDFPKKKVWKPLVIAVILVILFVTFILWAQSQTI